MIYGRANVCLQFLGSASASWCEPRCHCHASSVATPPIFQASSFLSIFVLVDPRFPVRHGVASKTPPTIGQAPSHPVCVRRARHHRRVQFGSNKHGARFNRAAAINAIAAGCGGTTSAAIAARAGAASTSAGPSIPHLHQSEAILSQRQHCPRQRPHARAHVRLHAYHARTL